MTFLVDLFRVFLSGLMMISLLCILIYGIAWVIAKAPRL